MYMECYKERSLKLIEIMEKKKQSIKKVSEIIYNNSTLLIELKKNSLSQGVFYS